MQGTVAQGVLRRKNSHTAQGDDVRYELAAACDDAALRRLMRENTMPGRISLAMECEPSFFDALSIEGERCHAVVAREDESCRIVAMGTRSVREVFVNGGAVALGYLGHLRIDPRYRRRARLRADGYAMMRSLRCEDEAHFDLTCIMGDNREARRVLTAGVRGVPPYVECERIITLAISTHRRVHQARATPIDIEAGSARRLEEIIECLDRNNRRYQFAPRWTVDDFLSTERSRGLRPDDFHLAMARGRVVGVVARWNQRGFKQVVVRDYAPRLRRLRPVINGLAPLIRQPRLPAIGEPVNGVFLSHVAIDGDDPAVALSLIEAARRAARMRGHDLLMMGLSVRHPLLHAVRRAASHRACESILYLVNWTDDPNLVESLDGRVAHPEIATL